MLKNKRLLFMGLIVIAGSACVTPTHASSASSVIITYIQPAGAYGAKDELIVLYNNSPAEVDITHWCLSNKAVVPFACFTPQAPPGYTARSILPGYGAATIASFEYINARALLPEAVSVMYEVTNQSSGSMVGSSDTITLVNEQSEPVSQWSWTSALSSIKAWNRLKLFEAPDLYSIDDSPASWHAAPFVDLPTNGAELRFIEHEQQAPHPDTPHPGQSALLAAIRISELLPNADGADAGKEFVELHNTSPDQSYLLDGFVIQLGAEASKRYSLPAGIELKPNEYVAFYDSQLGFTLPNTQASIQLYWNDTAIGEPVLYASPKEDQSWAYIEGAWQYVSVPSPGAPNTLAKASETSAANSGVANAPKPCATNQFRNPETGRCKLLASTSNAPTPCKPGQERNPETNRCRTAAVAKAPTPCKEGQERNPDTNRCRNIVKMSSASHGVKGVQMQAAAQLNWYYWAGIVAIVAAVLGYAAWEWRQEIVSLAGRLRRLLVKR